MVRYICKVMDKKGEIVTSERKGIPSKTLTYTCDDISEFDVQKKLRKSKIKIGDTGSSLRPPYGRDVQIPSSQVTKAKKIIKENGCKVLSVKKDFPMKG